MECLESLFSTRVGIIVNPTVLSVFTVVLMTTLASFLTRKLFMNLQDSVKKSPNYWSDALPDSGREPAVYLIRVVGMC
jgi:hypothetical protein|tara:strand:- start:17435 stop:17668 length:234 start_codon:yes stop_codon:yes gene_type:complete